MALLALVNARLLAWMTPTNVRPVMSDTRLRQRVGNLPAEVTSFVDRRREISEAKQVLSTTRLLT